MSAQNSSTLSAHDGSSRKIRGRKCRFCPSAFTKAEHLKRHQRTHTGDRPYACTICGKTYARSDVLNRHYKLHSSPNLSEAALRPDDFGGSAPQRSSQNDHTQHDLAMDNPGNPGVPQHTADFQADPRLALSSQADASVFAISSSELSLPNMSAESRSLSLATPTECAASHDAASSHAMAAYGLYGATGGIVSLDEQCSIDPMSVDYFDDWLSSLTEGNTTRLYSLMNGRTGLHSSEPNFDGLFFDTPPVLPVLSRTADKSEIFDERMKRIQQQWPVRLIENTVPPTRLWRSLWMADTRNLIADSHLPRLHSLNPRTRWRLSDDTRRRLRSYITSPTDIPMELHEEAGSILLPPNEVLHIGLELFCRQFHTLQPFLHLPTFSPNEAPAATILSMCLIGFHILNTTGTNPWLAQVLLITLNKTRESIRRISDAQPMTAINTLMNAFLVLSLGAMTGAYAVQAAYRQLYRDTIHVAQQHQLFCSQLAYSRELTAFSNVEQPAQSWESWARVESAKRLIVCLLMTDSWHADVFRTAPIIQTNYCQILLPCSDSIFQCPSRSRWTQMIQEHYVDPTAVVSCPGSFIIQTSPSRVISDTLAMYAILCAIRLRLRASYHSITRDIHGLPGSDPGVSTPWEWYQSDLTSQDVGTLLLDLPNHDSMRSMNANCALIWHHTCMSLAADLVMFDHAAGQSGPELARAARTYLDSWSKTTAARRACVHAAQAFRVMTERRANEGVMFAAVPLLFQCALVLAFYTLCRPSPVLDSHGDSATPIYDILTPVDWAAVGAEGFYASVSNIANEEKCENPTIGFIRREAEMCFGNSTQSSDHQSSRLILLEYAGLLDEIGTKWKIGDYANISRILSETIFNSQET